jgi:hypothetical protein
MKFLVDSATHEELKQKIAEWQVKEKELEQRAMFLQKQADSLRDDEEKNHNTFWDFVRRYLESKELLKNYDHKTHRIKYSNESGQFFLIEKEQRPSLPAFLAQMFHPPRD